MRPWRPETVLLSFALLLLVANPALAGRRVPRDALVEELARGATLPEHVLEAGPATAAGPRAGRSLRRTTTAAERAWIKRLADAHRRDDMAPFREALTAPSTWVREVALEGIPRARLVYAVAGSGGAEGAVRRTDLRRVSAFLPEFRALALAAPPKNAAGGPSRVRELALRALGRLAACSHHPKTADKAFAALVEVASTDARKQAIRGLVAALRARPKLRPGTRARAVLLDFAAAELKTKRVGRDAGFLIGRLNEPKLTEALHALVRSYTPNFTGLTFLAQAGHPGASAFILKELESHPVRRTRVLEAARLMPSEAYLPALRQELAADVISYRQTLDALVAIGGPAVAEILRAEVLKLLGRTRGAVDDELLVPAADAWLTVDPSGAPGLRARLARLGSMPRLAVLRALARHGAPGLLPAVQAELRGKTRVPVEQVACALDVVACLVRRGEEPGALALLHTQLKRWHPKVDPQGFGAAPYGTAGRAALDAVRTAGARDRATEALLLEWLDALRPELVDARMLVVRAMGAVGGPRSREVLEPLCAWPTTLPKGAPQLRLVARSAVARLEQREEN